MKSYFYEDFEVGQTFISGGRTITETDLTMFSMISGDWNPIHADMEFAKKTKFEQRVVHGVLGIAVSTGMMHELGIFHESVIAMLGYKRWEFRLPLFINDTLHLKLTILNKSLGKSGNNGKLERSFRLINQNGEVVQEGESDVLVLTKQGFGERNHAK